MSQRKNAPSTDLIHHAYEPPAGFKSVVPGIHKASTVIFQDTTALRARQWKEKTGYTYGLHGTPSTFTLEERLAALEGGLQTLLAPSGLAAIALVDMALLQADDEVLIPDNAYGPNKDLARGELARWGVTHRFYDPMCADALAALITPKTKLIWLEAAGSVTLEFPDLLGLLRAARQHPQLIVAMDNTWGAGLAFDTFAFDETTGQGVDISVHALTKYPSGGADVLMGSVTTRDEDLHVQLKMTHMRMGLGVGGNDVEAVLRGLPSLPLRYAAHDAATRRIAEWWQTRPEVTQVLHPALPTSPGHAHWAETCQAAGGLVSVIFDQRYSASQVDAFIDALKLFKIGYSWGGPVSLAVPYHLPSMRSVGDVPQGTLVRMAIGLEDPEDLINDLELALAAVFRRSA
jgi:cystathionine beta-lyase